MRKQAPQPISALDKSTYQGVFWGLLAIAFVSVFLFYREVFGFNTFRELHRALFPCKSPIEYSLTRFDDRFDISEQQFLEAVREAEILWEEALDQQLFVYVEDNEELSINLIYDYRQAGTERLEQLGLNIQTNNESYEALKVEYDAAYDTYLAQKAELDVMLKAHEARSAAYTAEVERTNASGGANPREYRQLEAERVALNAEAAAINAKVKDINETADTVNILADALNNLAEKLNLTADHYNTIGDALGDEFVEGTFGASATGGEINIYQFENQEKLIRVLAHELGHALGLEHVDDPDAIMYRLNENENYELTEADIDELKRVCRLD